MLIFTPFYGRGNRYLESNGNMTQIATGIINNQTFLMIDCVATVYHHAEANKRRYNFVNKLSKFHSVKDTYYALAGNDGIAQAINIYDDMLYVESKTMDYESETFIEEILDVFKFLNQRNEYNWGEFVTLGYCRLYIIDKDKILYYSLFFDNKGNLNGKPEKSYIKNNHIILPPNANGDETKIDSTLTIETIYDHCKKEMIKKNRLSIDLKNRFSFISFIDGVSKYITPCIDKEEYVKAFVGADYNEISILD